MTTDPELGPPYAIEGTGCQRLSPLAWSLLAGVSLAEVRAFFEDPDLEQVPAAWVRHERRAVSEAEAALGRDDFADVLDLLAQRAGVPNLARTTPLEARPTYCPWAESGDA